MLLGNQQLLMQLINKGEFKIESLNSYKSKDLNGFLKKIGIDKKDIRK